MNRDEDSPMPEAPEPVPRPGEAEAAPEAAGEAVESARAPSLPEIARFFA
ncbi:hypothetical protein [Catenulispora sp. EB89]